MRTAPKTTSRRPLATGAAFRTLYEHSPIGIAELDDDGRFLRVNKALRKMLGRSEAELRRLTFNEVAHPDDRAECYDLFKRVVTRSIEHFEMEKRFLPKAGGILWSHTVVTGVRSGRGSCTMIGMINDVTERRKAQDEFARLKTELEDRVADRTAALSYQAALLTAQMESSPDGIIVVDAKGGIVSRNKRFAAMWDVPDSILEELAEVAMAAFLAKLNDPAAFLERVRQYDQDRNMTGTDVLRLRDGRVFERYTSPMTGKDGRYYGRVWRFRDVTERTLHDAETQEKTEALARSNSELEMYAYAASHDLSAPLRKIISFGDLLEGRAKGKLDAAELEFLERMRKAASAALKLVGDMLTLSRVGRDALSLEEVDLGSVLDEVKTVLAPELEGARIDAGRLPVLRAHATLMHALLMNLLSNACKFRSPMRPLIISIESRRDDAFVEITVADNGIGFDQEYAEKIFRPFLRLHTASDYEGSGIGLAICRRVALRYGGTLTAESEPGKGSTFLLRLPAAMLVR